MVNSSWIFAAQRLKVATQRQLDMVQYRPFATWRTSVDIGVGNNTKPTFQAGSRDPSHVCRNTVYAETQPLAGALGQTRIHLVSSSAAAQQSRRHFRSAPGLQAVVLRRDQEVHRLLGST